MAIDYDRLMALEILEITADYGSRDVILYALGLGLYADGDETQLPFVYEQGLKVLPTFALTLGLTGDWLRRDAGIDYTRIVHGEQSMEIHAPVPTEGRVTARARVTEVIDKGEGKGALLYYERVLLLEGQTQPLVTMRQTIFCRGDGGFGGPPRTQPPVHPMPERAPDLTVEHVTTPQQALIYRLSGDMNPLHADPEVAGKAGFPRPILHGLATFGIAGHSVIRGICDGDPDRLTSIAGRFTAPVFPGETFQTDLWRDGEVVSFRTRSRDRDVVAINNGRATIR